MANSKRKCAHCKTYFRPDREFPGPLAWCSAECGRLFGVSVQGPATQELLYCHYCGGKIMESNDD